MDFIRVLRDLQERTSRPGLLGIAGRAAEKRCADDLSAYFKSLARKITELNIGQLALESRADIAADAVRLRLNNLLRHRSTTLVAILAVNIAKAFAVADKQVALTEAAATKHLTLDKLEASGKEAADYAAKRAATLVKDLNKTTIQRIADAVSKAIEDRLGVGGANRLIREVVEDMSTARAKVIASTEMNDAMSEAALRKIKRLEIEWKQIILSDDACEICQSIADDGPVPVDEPFVDKDGEEYDRTPIHPNCRCATTGARAPKGEAA